MSREKAITQKPPTMQQGHSDDFQTPPIALTPLFPYLRPEWRIWEPCCGKGNLVRGMREAGHCVVGSDIKNGMDMLIDQPAEWDALITNPPFSCKDKVLARCYALGKPFALLLPLTAFESQKRQALFRKYSTEFVILDRRLDFETPNNCENSRSWFATMWVTAGLNIGQQITFAQIPKITGKPIQEQLAL